MLWKPCGWWQWSGFSFTVQLWLLQCFDFTEVKWEQGGSHQFHILHPSTAAQAHALPASIQRMHRDVVLGRSRNIFLSPFHSVAHGTYPSPPITFKAGCVCTGGEPDPGTQSDGSSVLPAAGREKRLSKLGGLPLLMFLWRKNCQVLRGSERK